MQYGINPSAFQRPEVIVRGIPPGAQMPRGFGSVPSSYEEGTMLLDQVADSYYAAEAAAQRFYWEPLRMTLEAGGEEYMFDLGLMMIGGEIALAVGASVYGVYKIAEYFGVHHKNVKKLVRKHKKHIQNFHRSGARTFNKMSGKALRGRDIKHRNRM